jgi:FkbM family methyltransferase
MNDYSQHGEGKVIADYFNGYVGNLISLGENDGKTLSNVLGLIEVGWSAKLVEPSESVYQKLEDLHRNNKKVDTFNFAIADKDGEIAFYESGTHLKNGDLALLSSIDSNEIKKWKKTTEFKEKKAPCFKWETFVRMTKTKNVDFISIDCEGVDFEILTKIDFNKLAVKMVCVESNSVDNQKYINHMASFGYSLYYSNYCNLIFTK